VAHLTPVAKETLLHVARSTFAGEWARARRHGERPSLASLHARGFVIRRAWRGTEGDADAAYEYQLTPELRAAMAARSSSSAAGKVAV
jgi:hypothetical protein